jgi:hypothetical protein
MLMVESIGVKKKKYSFHKRKKNIVDCKGSISRIQKVLLKKSVHNVGAAKCCAMNCCQHFPHEKILFRQKFWSLSFEDYKAYGLDILRMLHTKGDKNQGKFVIIQGFKHLGKFGTRLLVFLGQHICCTN